MYSSTKDVRTALTPGAVEGDKATASGLDDWQIVDAIEEADSVIDGYLPGGYVVTLTVLTQDDDTVEVAIAPFRYWSRNIAAWLAMLTFKQNKDVPEDDPVRLRYTATMVALQRLFDGDLQLPPSDPDYPVEPDADASLVVFNQYEGTMFGMEDFDLTISSGMREYDARARDLL